MSTGLVARLAELAAELVAAAESVPEIRKAHTDPGANMAVLPAVMVGPPRLDFEAYVASPTSATFLVIVCVASSDRAMPLLWRLAPALAEAIHDRVADAVVRSAQPGAWTTGTTELPCYELTVDTSL